eukprot:m.382471 g.382471  ORF g.382471 m.382471 type:complete len:53 (-) comp16721_c1_seq5:387-545(-)
MMHGQVQVFEETIKKQVLAAVNTAFEGILPRIEGPELVRSRPHEVPPAASTQ